METKIFGVIAFFEPLTKQVLIEVSSLEEIDHGYELALEDTYFFEMPDHCYDEGENYWLNDFGRDIMYRLGTKYPSDAYIPYRASIETALAKLVGIEELNDYGRWLSKYIDFGPFYQQINSQT